MVVACVQLRARLTLRPRRGHSGDGEQRGARVVVAVDVCNHCRGGQRERARDGTEKHEGRAELVLVLWRQPRKRLLLANTRARTRRAILISRWIQMESLSDAAIQTALPFLARPYTKGLTKASRSRGHRVDCQGLQRLQWKEPGRRLREEAVQCNHYGP